MELDCKGCHKKVDYESYKRHLTDCDAASTVNCPLECGFPDDMVPEDCASHIELNCGLTELSCTLCNGNVKRKDIEVHDCITALKAELVALQAGKGSGTKPVTLADFDLDKDDGNSKSIDFRGQISVYYGLCLSIGKELKPDDTHTLMP